MKERDSKIEEPEASDGGQYEAHASATSAPSRTPPAENDAQAIDERAATTKTRPMAQVDREPAEPDGEDGSALRRDDRWQYFAGEWDAIQAGFVDDPRRTVEQADRLVGEVIDHLSKVFKEERTRLESQWARGGKPDTEALRLAMRRYREFFQALVGR
jgi:hypothetical protein